MTNGDQPDGGAISVEQALAIASELRRRGRVDEARLQANAILEVAPLHYETLVLLAEIHEASGQLDNAIETYAILSAMVPGHGKYFSRISCLKLQRAFGPPPNARPCPTDKPSISMRALGELGRFGNQLIQYAFVRLAADAHGAEPQFPDWLGRYLFDLDDPYPEQPMPVLSEDATDLSGALDPASGMDLVNRDLHGFFNLPTRLFAPHRERIRRFFEPGERIRARIEDAVGIVRSRGATVVALHLRRGDFGTGKFWIAPEQWYLDWLAAIWPTLDDPVLYIASDDPGLATAFSAYRPLTADSLSAPQPGAEFLEDFFLLASAHVLAISNSTFSGMAALLNESAGTFLRPERSASGLVAFDPWDTRLFIE